MMQHLEEHFLEAGVPFDRNGNRVRYLEVPRHDAVC